MQSHFIERLQRPVDIAPLAVFRILMGFLMAAEGFGAILTGWVRVNYVEAPFAFHFIGFGFLDVLVGPQAYAVYGALGLAGLGVSLGYRYRLSIVTYTVLWAAVYFGQKTSYNNHYYLLLLMSVLLCLVPAHRFASFDVRRGRVRIAQTTAAINVVVFKLLLLIVFVYAALAKLYPDWLDGTVIRIFLSGKSDWPILGPLTDQDLFVYGVGYGGILFDFLVVPALWYRKTRVYAFGVSLFFHLFNSLVFHIGIFPYMMLITTVLFFNPATVRRVFRISPFMESHKNLSLAPTPVAKTVFLSIFFTAMIVLPLRHYFIPGCVHWTEEGHRMAWHMMLRSKYGYLTYLAEWPDGSEERINPSDRMPAKMAATMATRPDMIWQYAQRLERECARDGQRPIGVYALSRVSLNGRKLYPLIDPAANLVEVPWRNSGHRSWILLLPASEGCVCL